MTDVTTGDRDRTDASGQARRDGREVSAFARRVGPIVAAIGVLGGIAVLVWVVLAPDNVVGPVDEAPFALDATAVTVVEDRDCLLLVAGDGTSSEVCPDWDGDRVAAAWWDGEGEVVADAGGGMVTVDVDTGAVTPLGPDEEPFADERAPGVDLEQVHPDGAVVREGPWGRDGEVVLDLGGPAARIDTAVMSPDGELVVAVDSDQRVLVAAADDPADVYLWFEAPPGSWFDPFQGLRWQD